MVNCIEVDVLVFFVLVSFVVVCLIGVVFSAWRVSMAGDCAAEISEWSCTSVVVVSPFLV